MRFGQSVLCERIAKEAISFGFYGAETWIESGGAEELRGVSGVEPLNAHHHAPSRTRNAELRSVRPSHHRKNEATAGLQIVKP